jgi:acylphosphatase
MDAEPDPPVARNFEIRGRMQGVGFRHQVRGAAVSCGLAGWARNGAGGSVEVHVQGSPDQLARFRSMISGDSNYAERLLIKESDAQVEPCAGFESRQ